MQRSLQHAARHSPAMKGDVDRQTRPRNYGHPILGQKVARPRRGAPSPLSAEHSSLGVFSLRRGAQTTVSRGVVSPSLRYFRSFRDKISPPWSVFVVRAALTPPTKISKKGKKKTKNRKIAASFLPLFTLRYPFLVRLCFPEIPIYRGAELSRARRGEQSRAA